MWANRIHIYTSISYYSHLRRTTQALYRYFDAVRIVAFLLLTVLVLAVMGKRSQVAIFALDSNNSILSFFSKCEKMTEYLTPPVEYFTTKMTEFFKRISEQEKKLQVLEGKYLDAVDKVEILENTIYEMLNVMEIFAGQHRKIKTAVKIQDSLIWCMQNL